MFRFDHNLNMTACLCAKGRTGLAVITKKGK